MRLLWDLNGVGVENLANAVLIQSIVTTWTQGDLEINLSLCKAR